MVLRGWGWRIGWWYAAIDVVAEEFVDSNNRGGVDLVGDILVCFEEYVLLDSSFEVRKVAGN